MGKRGIRHKPTEESRLFVSRAIASGFTKKSIAEALIVDKKTFLKHYKYEINLAKMELVNKAVGVIDHHLDEDNLDAAKHVTIRLAQWSERQEVVTKNKAPPKITYVLAKDGD